MRVEFVCGARALRSYRELRAAVGGSVRLLSVLPEQLPEAIEKLQAAGRAQQKAQDSLHERLSPSTRRLHSRPEGKRSAASRSWRRHCGWDANGLKKLAAAVTAAPGLLAVLISSESPSLVVVSRSSRCHDRRQAT